MLRRSSESAGLAVANAAGPGGSNPGIPRYTNSRSLPAIRAWAERRGHTRQGSLAPVQSGRPPAGMRAPFEVVPTPAWQLPAGRLGLMRGTTQRPLFTLPARAWPLLRREG